MREDWIEVKIGEVFDIITGTTPSKRIKDNYGDFIPFVKPPDINNSPINNTSDFLSESGKLKGRVLPVNSVLITCIGNLGRVGINEKYEIAFNQQINALKPLSYIYPKFTFYQAQSLRFRTQLEKLSTSTTVALVNKSRFSSIGFSLPPLPIQRAIVQKIETLFASLDKGIADLKTAQQQLKVYRQAVLSLAVNKSKKIPISELVLNLSQGWSPKCLNESSRNNNEWAVIKTTAIQSLQFEDSENKILPANLEPRKQHEIKVGDILITRAGPRIRVGICCLVRNTRPKLINCDKVYRLNVNYAKVLPDFFEYSLNAPEHLKLIEIIKTGSSDSGLNLTQNRFLTLEIPLPELSEQRKIIKEIESRLSVCDKVEQSITEALEKAEALRQSILKKAFEGLLLSEAEIAKCKQEADYEPAAMLLEKYVKTQCFASLKNNPLRL